MLAVNSSPRDSRRNDIEGSTSHDVLPSVFKELQDISLQNLLLPVLGGHRLGDSCQSIVSNMIIHYAESLRSRRELYDLTLTLTKSDLSKGRFNLIRIKDYLRETCKFFR